MSITNGIRRLVDPTVTLLLAALLGNVGATARSAEPPAVPLDGPLAPALALKSFRVEPGVRIELVAAEPLAVSPVACAFDAKGRLFVAENRGYPTGPKPGEGPLGRIAMLEDVDGDGRMDRRTDYALGLTFPNGVMPWKGGLIVTCAPEVLWLRDNDGDGKADERHVLFTGFSTQGSTQLRVSHPTLSLDNWIYLTSGLTGGSVTSPDHPKHAPVTLGRTDFRFRSDGSSFEAADGGAQFGLTFDDFGRRFICYNRVQVQHVVIDSSVLRRNPHLAFSETVQDCPAEMVAEPLKGHGASARLFPISRNVTTADSHAGTFTAACAVTVFRGTGLPDRFRGDVFSCDPTGNLVHADRLDPAGVTFAARPTRAGAEFLASTDNWFRPVFLTPGPDGALYVCDMYRGTIEHPDYLPIEIRKRTDFEGGKTMGRIWRLVRDDAKPDDLKRLRLVNLAGAAVPELCSTLLERDGWRRETAHRLLLEGRELSAAGPLSTIAADPASPPAAVVLALWLLETFEKLTDDEVRHGLKSAAPEVREQALRLAESRLEHEPKWLPAVLARANDANPRVRFQAAIALYAAARTGADARLTASALARIAALDGADRWLRAAVFSSLEAREKLFLGSLRELASRPGGLPPELLTEHGRLLAASATRKDWGALIHEITRQAEGPSFTVNDQAALLTGLAEAVRGKLDPAGAADVLSALAGDDHAAAGSMAAVVAAMTTAALDSGASPNTRREAVGLLGCVAFDRTGAVLLRLLDPSQPAGLRVSAVRALGAQRDPRVSSALLAPERFAAYTPALRDEVLSALLSQTRLIPGVLTAVEEGRVPAGAIDVLRRRQLSQHADPTIRKRAETIFGAVAGDRAKVYDSYKDVVAVKADAANGKLVFKRECASCHRLDQDGFAVGPDLFGVRNQTKEAILLHVLAPDQEITQGFASYTVATKDGRVLTGLIASETPTSITLRQPLGKEDTLLRDDIEQISAGKQSLMPQGIEKTVSRREFADLLSYLKGEGPPAAP